jgi:hypothetical protein
MGRRAGGSVPEDDPLAAERAAGGVLSAYSKPVTGPLPRISASPSRTTTTSCDGINPDMPAHLLMSCPRLPVAPGQGLPFTWVQYCQLVQRSGLTLPSHAPAQASGR